MELTCGTRLAVREREGEGKRARNFSPGWLGPIWAPGTAQVVCCPLFLYFFLLFSFYFVSEFCFGFLKMLSKSDLNKIKSDHFCTLKSVP
jgi:hypothetical protein